MRHLQKINNWEENQVNGIEVYLDDFSKIDQLEKEIYNNIDYDLGVTSIKKSRADLFNWLELQDINVVIIIGLLLLVSGINIIATLLILIIEKTNTIGILKALGAQNLTISKIFILNALYLILTGLVIGNIIGLGLSILQLKLGIVKLPQEAYFIDKVPILINPFELVALNLGTVLFCLLVLIVPSRIVSKIEPIKSIRFD
jgi:lipoprotein-releasing system permease protein